MAPGRTFAARRLPPAALLLLAGCMGGPSGAVSDPLVGSGPPLPRGGPAAAAAVPGKPTPAPVNAGPASPAALAGGAVRPPLNGTPVASLPPADGANWHPAGATLKRPEPIDDPAVKRTTDVEPPQPGGDDFQRLQDQLMQRHVLYQELTMDDRGVWRFTCGVPSPKDPEKTRVYEYSAPGERGLAAMRVVLEQIDRDRLGPQ
jgi:hypothetical protein